MVTGRWCDFSIWAKSRTPLTTNHTSARKHFEYVSTTYADMTYVIVCGLQSCSAYLRCCTSEQESSSRRCPRRCCSPRGTWRSLQGWWSHSNLDRVPWIFSSAEMPNEAAALVLPLGTPPQMAARKTEQTGERMQPLLKFKKINTIWIKIGRSISVALLPTIPYLAEFIPSIFSVNSHFWALAK